jgi:hypothetical protein
MVKLLFFESRILHFLREIAAKPDSYQRSDKRKILGNERKDQVCEFISSFAGALTGFTYVIEITSTPLAVTGAVY